VTYVQASRLKVTRAAHYRLSNSSTSDLRAVCGGAPQTFFPDIVRGVDLIPPEDQHEPSGAVEIDYKFLAENCADILCSVGADHAIRYVSPSALDTLNWDPGEMIGKDFDEFVFSEDVAVLEDIATGSAEDGAAYSHVRVRLLKKDQTPVWTSINARCVRDPVSGEPRVYVLSMRDITGRKVLEEKLSVLAMTDALTGLWNRRAFDQALRREWKRAVRDESQLSLLLLDLDHFKLLNDQYGHPLGDECLTTVASAISDTVRASDVVCRWGGDEIAIILPGTDHAGAARTAEKARAAVEVLRFRVRKNAYEWVPVTASIGVATAISQPAGSVTTPQNLLLAADKALYKAKHDGQNRAVVAPPAVPVTQAADGKLACEKPKRMQGMGDSREGPPNDTDGL
jgi:diguanylate cyclase (GGDEF)-like protein/PAS domain S-box-containing protein